MILLGFGWFGFLLGIVLILVCLFWIFFVLKNKAILLNLQGSLGEGDFCSCSFRLLCLETASPRREDGNVGKIGSLEGWRDGQFDDWLRFYSF